MSADLTAKNGYKTPLKKELDFYNNQAMLEAKQIRHWGLISKVFYFSVTDFRLF